MSEPLVNEKRLELLEQFRRLQQRHQRIRGKLFSRKAPNYNTYVRLFGRDLVDYFTELEDMIEGLIWLTETTKEREN